MWDVSHYKDSKRRRQARIARRGARSRARESGAAQGDLPARGPRRPGREGGGQMGLSPGSGARSGRGRKPRGWAGTEPGALAAGGDWELPGIENRTLFTGDNLEIMRGLPADLSTSSTWIRPTTPTTTMPPRSVRGRQGPHSGIPGPSKTWTWRGGARSPTTTRPSTR